jgi:hypothetical protein
MMEKTGVHGENEQYVASQCKTLSHNVVSSTPRSDRESSSQRGKRPDILYLSLAIQSVDCVHLLD